MAINDVWSQGKPLGDIHIREIKTILNDSVKLLELVKLAIEDNCGMRTFNARNITKIVHNVATNLVIELARREIGYDRQQLRRFGKMKLHELTQYNHIPKGEFIKAYLMRFREITGKEISVEDVNDANIEISK